MAQKMGRSNADRLAPTVAGCHKAMQNHPFMFGSLTLLSNSWVGKHVTVEFQSYALTVKGWGGECGGRKTPHNLQPEIKIGVL